LRIGAGITLLAPTNYLLSRGIAPKAYLNVGEAVYYSCLLLPRR